MMDMGRSVDRLIQDYIHWHINMNYLQLCCDDEGQDWPKMIWFYKMHPIVKPFCHLLDVHEKLNID